MAVFRIEKTKDYTWAPMAASNLTWKVTGLDGSDTDLATVSGTGVVTATGAGNGKVKVTATFINNADIVTERVITITNQAGNDAFKTIIAAESYDTAAEAVMPGTSIVPGMTNILTYSAATGLTTNQTGAYSNIAANSTIVFRDVDFGIGADEVCFRLAGTTATNITLRIDGKVTIRIEKFNFAEVSVKAWFEDAEPGAEKAIPVKTMAPTLWIPDVTESGGVITVAFAESITFAAKKSATVRGAAATGMAIVDDKKLEITGYGEAVCGGNLVIAGIKYPDLFPSYSFAFTLAIE